MDGWEPLPADVVLRVDLRTLEEQLLPVRVTRGADASVAPAAPTVLPGARHESQEGALRAMV